MSILSKRIAMIQWINNNGIEINNNEVRKKYDAETENISVGSLVARCDEEKKEIHYYIEVSYDAEYYGEQVGLIELDLKEINQFKANVEILASRDCEQEK